MAALLKHILERATRTLQAIRHGLERCAQALLQLETLDTPTLKQHTCD